MTAKFIEYLIYGLCFTSISIFVVDSLRIYMRDTILETWQEYLILGVIIVISMVDVSVMIFIFKFRFER